MLGTTGFSSIGGAFVHIDAATPDSATQQKVTESSTDSKSALPTPFHL